MAAADILIAPSGGHAVTFNAEAYALLAAGSKSVAADGRNIARWQSGFRYAPVAGLNWGKASGPAANCQVPVEHYPVGGDDALLDGRVYYVPGSLNEGNCPLADYADGVWKVRLATSSAGFSTSPVWAFYAGASAGALASSLVIGTKYQAATSLANVQSGGGSKAGMRAGLGWWFAAGVSTSTAAYIYIYTGTASQRPDVYYGGFAVSFYCGSNASPSIASPRFSPFVFGRQSDITFDPSGSIIRPGFRLIGFPLGLYGCPTGAIPVADRPISDVLYQDINCYSEKEAIYLGSDQVGSTLNNWRVEGSGSVGCRFDNLNIPDYSPGNASASDSSETLSIERRVKGFEFYNGTASVGICHGVVNVANSGTPTEEEESVVSIDLMRATCRPDAGYTRGATMNGCADSVLSRGTFIDFSASSQLAGKRTLVINSAWIGSYPCIDGDYTYTNNGAVMVLFDADAETVPGDMSIRFYRNIVNRIGSTARGVDWNMACLGASAGGGITWSARSLDLQGNVFLQDPGRAIWKTREYGGGTVSRDQIFSGNFDNYLKDGSAGPVRHTAASQAEGTEQSYATFFSASSAENLARNVNDTAANIARRGDCPARIPGALALARAS